MSRGLTQVLGPSTAERTTPYTRYRPTQRVLYSLGMSTTNIGGIHNCAAQESFGPEKAEDGASVPCADSLAALGGEAPGKEGQPPRHACLSSDDGSEANDAFPNALALDSACSAPSQTGSLPRNPSANRMLGVFRRVTNNSNPGSHDAPRREDTGRDTARLCAQRTHHTKMDDAQRIAVPSRPSDPRPSQSTFVWRAREVSRKLSELIGIAGTRASVGGVGSAAGSDGTAATTTTTAATAALDWKPHENILKVLGYRPRGHGQRFIDRYKLGETLGTGGFGVVREGE